MGSIGQRILKAIHKWIRDEIDPTLSAIQIHRTIDYAYQAYYDYMDDVARMADSWLEEARKKKQKIIILCGRPYHIDPEVIHGIDQYLTSLGCLVLSEDSIAHHTKKADTDVLNQWTYHARLYAVAEYVAKSIVLICFWCSLSVLDAASTPSLRMKSEPSLKTVLSYIPRLRSMKLQIWEPSAFDFVLCLQPPILSGIQRDPVHFRI